MNRNNNYLIGNDFAAGHAPNKGCFKKGRKPWNKGMKGFRPSRRTEFQKGHSPATRLPVGIVRKRADKNTGTLRNFIKIQEPNVWLEYARYVWLRQRGPIQAGLFVHHKDGNSLNDDLANLELITKKRLCQLHSDQLHEANHLKHILHIDCARIA